VKTHLVDGAPLRSIGDWVKHDSPLLGFQRFLGLNLFIQVDQLLSDRLAEQVGHSPAVILRDGVNLGLVVRLIGIGNRDLAINRRLQDDCVRAI
jgi:hypothetical protein